MARGPGKVSLEALTPYENGWLIDCLNQICCCLQEYAAADGSKQRPIMLHRAIFGSIERFFGILVENYAGAFPLWLAPVQVRSTDTALNPLPT